MKRITIALLVGLGAAGMSHSSANAAVSAQDSIRLDKVRKVLKAVDDLDDMKLYGDVAELIYHANTGNSAGELAGMEILKFGTPEQVARVRAALPDSILCQENVQRYLRYADARAKTMPGTKYVDLEGEDVAGNKVKLSDFVKPGRYTLVDFWASWCPYCVRELPDMARLRDSFSRDDFEVVGVAVREETAKTQNMVQKKGIGWPVVYNTERIPYDIYGFVGIPHHILIGPDGTIISRGESLDQIAGRLSNLIKK